MATAALVPAGTPEAPDSEGLFEIVNGERREIPRMGFFAGTLASLLAYHLNTHGLQQKLGLAVVEVLFRILPQQPSRRPDVAFVRYERWPVTAFPTSDPAELEAIPNLAVEVVSPSNAAEEIEDKLKDYFDAGVELVWVIYPRHRRIYVYSTPTEIRLLGEADELDGGKVLPGFKLGIATLFKGLVKPS